MGDTNIIVRDMKMPENCISCDFCKHSPTRAGYYVCTRLYDYISIDKVENSRLKNCPLFELKNWRNV